MAAGRDRRALPSEVRAPLHTTFDAVLTPCRKRLEHDGEELPCSKVDPNQQIGDVQELDVDARSITQIEVPPWSESYELSSTDVDGKPLRTRPPVLCLTCL